MSAPSILFFDAKSYDREFFQAANGNFGYELTFLGHRLTGESARLAEGHDAVCAFVNDRLSPEVADTLADSGIGLVALRCAGYNNVDLRSFFGRIHVVRVPAYSPHAVAEHTLALILSLNRKTHRAYYRTRDGNFAIEGLLGFDMAGKTAGVVGTGSIGRCAAQLLRGFGMEVLAFDVNPDLEWAERSGVTYVDMGELYRRSHLITLHCPLTSDNHHMINADTIGQMRDGVMIINTGRGGLIDAPALTEALKDRKVGAAGLDVYEEEDQYFFEDFSVRGLDDDVLARLLTFPNVLITSHQAFFTREALTNIADTTLGNIRDYFEGRPLENEICYRCCDEGCRKEEKGRCFESGPESAPPSE
ncbi:2-hydroxyacid dehydrogenase [Kiritimatiella glycovorans]|uniref:D-lactate dehydrogenase n=1 Tax=Kiritimatiella glycovorans TaxID=1307763 RepID=A0A0G3EMP6_9BACT|nr:2-hydroxyacid dehydrogenase [Kiritimatiella glycovorans]AKJ65379.1 D-lactate dehydrogenase [Kiritimatiella glycovorans]